MSEALANIHCDNVPSSVGQLAPYKEPSMMETLQNKRIVASAKLEEIDAAIAALTANPEIEKVLTAIGRTLRY